MYVSDAIGRSRRYPLAPPEHRVFLPVLGRLAHKVAHKKTPGDGKQGSTAPRHASSRPETWQPFRTPLDATKPRYRLRVAVLTYFHFEQKRVWPDGRRVGGGHSPADYYAPLDRRALSRWLSLLGLTPSPPVLSRALTSLETAGLVTFYPGDGKPRERYLLTPGAERAVVDNLVRLLPDDLGVFVRVGVPHDDVAVLQQHAAQLPAWALETLIPGLFEEMHRRLAEEAEIS